METPNDPHAELPLDTAGARLRRAREAAGLEREDIAARTRIGKRHIAAIEEERFGDLAGRTYAIGFARSYARVVGLDEQQIAAEVRRQLADDESARPRPQHETFEPGDPARVPPARLAWLSGLGVLVVLVLLYVFWRSFLAPQADLPALTQDPPPAAGTVTPGPARPPAKEAAPVRQPVVFTALAPRVWVKFSDAAGMQIFQKELGQGEKFTVPTDAEGPTIWTARPDALAITVGGKPVPRLADGPVTIKDVPVTAAALLARPAAAGPETSARTGAARPQSRSVSTDSSENSSISR